MAAPPATIRGMTFKRGGNDAQLVGINKEGEGVGG